MHLGDQMKTGLPHRLQQTITQHLQIEGQVSIQLRMSLGQFGVQGGEPRLHSFLGGRIRHGLRSDQAAPPMAATSAAKSIFSTSMPSPRLKRTKRRTWMFSPTLPATCFTSSSTVMLLSLM